jgi:uncharacterized protein YqgC (DUF456 family)
MLWILLAILMVLVAVGCWVLTVLAMPGNWVLVAVAALYWLVVPLDTPCTLGWPALLSLLALAGLGELLEFIASAAGVVRAGGSRSGALLAMAGSIVGAIVGVVVGLPIPVVGPLIAAVLFAGVGALGGAMLAESSQGKRLDHSWRIGQAAFWGRVLGSLAKIVVASTMVVAVVVGLIF